MDANYGTCNNLVVQEFISEAQICPGLMHGSSLLQTGEINPLDAPHGGVVAIEQVGVCGSGAITT